MKVSMTEMQVRGSDELKLYLYIDIYIILNFIMNLFLLMITAIVRQKRCHIFRLFLSSFAVSLLSAVSTYYLWGNMIWQIILAVIQMGGLVILAFEYEGIKARISDCVTFVFLTFFAGGSISVFVGFLSHGINRSEGISIVFIIVAVIFLFILFFVFRWEIIRGQHQKKSVMSAKIVHKGKEYRIRALYDTGNHLISPYTGEGVAVISKKLSEEMELNKEQNPILIPYTSVGGSGLLEAYRIDYVYLSDGKTKKSLLVAVSDNLREQSDIQMILNII